MVVLTGMVVTGVGNFSYWIERLKAHYRRKTGMSLFPGTLNVRLEEEYSVPTNPCASKPKSTAARSRST
jgi:riboflavin kinase